MADLIALVIDFVQTNRAKLVKFVAVTGGSVIAGQLILAGLLYLLEWPYLWANATSVAIMCMPNYLANRYWVWGKRTRNSFMTEVLPFWSMTLLAFAVSMVAVWYVDAREWPRFAVLVANFAAFGVVWVLKFFVLERYLFGSRQVSDDRDGNVTPVGS